ncbi:helix-turn-helix domain-containing protein [Reichenbachiella versicolor]|uniref:helix-turn-helix domain-containing protein n=1 Tax=Reichenbachiella versicolor TaxID=1821036 RepID=UPI000D6E73A5|nr:helix-turn-helix transcriptional regulator [Reichenbachiella versicolor]
MTTNQASARIFRYVRNFRKLNQKQLAVKLRVNQSTISKVEQAKHFPSPIVLKRLEEYMNTSFADLARLAR